ncbi:MAG: hypothetical protein ACR2P5_01245 [Gammaproteobacteria bacterium]
MTKTAFYAAKIFALCAAAAFLLIALAGVYKFNFTNGDIYIQTENGAVVKYGANKKQ